ncbi:MAG TPA: HD domain-containing protein [Thermoanaerobaculia bacterium]|nr:HD domain-containing protein [Thermoanaerobaculia bacterium]
MPKTLRNAPIRDWEAGDNVQGFALLTKKEQRQDRNGKSFLDMELADASGSMVAKVWADSPALNGPYEPHQFVAFRGSVKNYRDQLQLNIDECRQATDADRHYGFDESKLIPSTREDIDDLWRRLERIYTEDVERPVMRRLAAETIAIHGRALREHPAAKAMHHAYRGGLLEHVVSMAELGRLVCGHYRELDRDLVLVGVLFHDLGKLKELGAMPANDYTLEGRLIGHVVMGRDLLIERCAAIPGFPEDLRVLLEHMVLSHQGKKEFASPVEPMTPEALALHFIDDLDSKINQLRNSREAATGMQFHRGLGRYVYLPPIPGPEEIQAAAEAAEIEAIAAEPHALEMAEMEMPPEEGEGDAVPAGPAEIQAGLFGGE